jgi:3-oxoacyl-[acyl-carrier-protein] synthase-3
MQSVGIVGLGHALPASVRTNDDPLFRGIRRQHAESELFYGVSERRVLAAGEAVEELMLEASRSALRAAGVDPSRIDRLYGTASISEYITPNGLFRVHRDLGLPSRSLVLPINAEFTTFILSCVLSWEAIAAGHCRHALVACGAHWTPHVDYAMPYSMVIGDGAAAAVIGPSGRLLFVDYATETLSELYDVMHIRTRPRQPGAERDPAFTIQEAGHHAFTTQGVEVPARLALGLLKKHGISSDQVALVSHESSKRLIDAWAERIRPAEYPEHLETLGDIPGCSVPMTLSMCESSLRSPYIVLISPGTGVHFAALLLKR